MEKCAQAFILLVLLKVKPSVIGVKKSGGDVLHEGLKKFKTNLKEGLYSHNEFHQNIQVALFDNYNGVTLSSDANESKIMNKRLFFKNVNLLCCLQIHTQPWN